MKVPLTFVTILVSINTMAQKEFPIYTNKIHNSIPCKLKMYTGKNPSGKTFYANITDPTLTVYIPVKKINLKQQF